MRDFIVKGNSIDLSILPHPGHGYVSLVEENLIFLVTSKENTKMSFRTIINKDCLFLEYK